jgi:hypothetical protein
MSSRLDQSASAMHSAAMAGARTLLCIAACLGTTGAGALQLVTKEEAALPNDPLGVTRGLTRGPDIVFVSPRPTAGLVKSPVQLKIRFQAHGGARIDPDSIVITYQKIPPIDMTQRLTPYTHADGIEVRDAELPAGTHRFRIDVKDTDGRSTTEILPIAVESGP